MNEKEMTTASHNNGNGKMHSGADTGRSTIAPGFTADHELVYRLKSAIDARGRYSFRLDDMAAGFAAGQIISSNAARRAIEERFTAHVGESPHQYLQRRFDDRRQEGDRLTRDNFAQDHER